MCVQSHLEFDLDVACGMINKDGTTMVLLLVLSFALSCEQSPSGAADEVID
jgi:hypothetical protein